MNPRFDLPSRQYGDEHHPSPDRFIESICKWTQRKIVTAADGERICQWVGLWIADPSVRRNVPPALFPPLYLNFEKQGCHAHLHLRDKGIPLLIRLYDSLDDAHTDVDYCRLAILNILVLYQTFAGAQKVAAVAQSGFAQQDSAWSVILGGFTALHPHLNWVMEEFGRAMPPSMINVAVLDAASQAAIMGARFHHPFNTPAGLKQLQSWLMDLDPEHYSFAHSATAALPFVQKPDQIQLLELAEDHPSVDVRVEAAWASTIMGQRHGLLRLADFASHLNSSHLARRYLEDFKAHELIPRLARDPDFQAMAEFAHLLSHDPEIGRYPDQITLYDTRELYWPPTEDRRRFWLFTFICRTETEALPDLQGMGILGSRFTCCLYPAEKNLSAFDAYSLQCCRELALNSDSRAPKVNTLESARDLLAQYNNNY